jgi:hypothetical protein
MRENRMCKKMQRQRPPLSLLALIAANLAPLFGVLFFGWDAAAIVLLYWIENLIIGAYNILRMILVKVKSQSEQFKKLFIIPFFCVHFGGFCAVHGFFLLTFFKLGGDLDTLAPQSRLYLYSFWSPLSHSSGKADRRGWNGRFYVLL